MPPESLWNSHAELAALCLLCVLLGQIAGRAVEGLIRKRKSDPDDSRMHLHSEELVVLKSRMDRVDRRLSLLEETAKEHRSWSESMTRTISERLMRMETIGDVLSKGQDVITERLDAILERLAK